MKQLPLSLEGSWLRVYQNVKDFSRKYHTIKIENSTEWSEYSIKVLQSQGSEMRHLEFNDCYFDVNKSNLMTRMFRLFQNLKVLKFHSTENDMFDEKKLKKIKPANLPLLKRVVLVESDFAVS